MTRVKSCVQTFGDQATGCARGAPCLQPSKAQTSITCTSCRLNWHEACSRAGLVPVQQSSSGRLSPRCSPVLPGQAFPGFLACTLAPTRPAVFRHAGCHGSWQASTSLSSLCSPDAALWQILKETTFLTRWAVWSLGLTPEQPSREETYQQCVAERWFSS
jgi:hypothetical protein